MRFLPFGARPAHRTGVQTGPERSPRGLLCYCAADCFPVAILRELLEPDYWRLEPTGLLAPHGNGRLHEEELIDEAVARWRVRHLVVCGHWPCRFLHDALAAPVWDSQQTAIESLRSLRPTVPGDLDQQRALAERGVHIQVAHLRTHPEVAAAAGKLHVHGWLLDERRQQLFFGPRPDGAMTAQVALHPDHNLGLQRRARRRAVSAPPPALDNRSLYLA